MESRLRLRKVKQATYIGALVNAFLGVIKVIVGWFGHSHALIADGIHSFSDLITDFMVVIASHYGAYDADSNHPYGHQRIETIATLFLSLLLIMVGLGLAWDAINHWLGGASVTPPIKLALVVALFSILANESLYHFTKFVANKYDSALLNANAWHHRSDALSSIVVLVGLIGEQLGFAYFDLFAAVIVALMIAHMGLKLGLDSVNELIDSGVSDDVLKKIRKIIESTPGVVALHELRTRRMGGAIYVDVHLIVSSHISVSEGHQIGQKVIEQLKTNQLAIKDVTIHIDPENDEVCAPCAHLPLRYELEAELKKRWHNIPGYEQLKHIQLHYLSGAVEVDLFFANVIKSEDVEAFKQQSHTLSYIHKLHFYQEL